MEIVNQVIPVITLIAVILSVILQYHLQSQKKDVKALEKKNGNLTKAYVYALHNLQGFYELEKTIAEELHLTHRVFQNKYRKLLKEKGFEIDSSTTGPVFIKKQIRQYENG